MIKRILFIVLMSIALSACLPTGFLSSKGNAVVGGAGNFIKGKAVKGFPSLPLYPKAKLLESYGANSNFGATAVTDDEISKVLEFYTQSLPQLGWEISLKQNTETNFTYEIKNSKQQGVVIVNTAADGKKTAITLSVSAR